MRALLCTLFFSLFAACANQSPSPGLQIANPASVYCVQQGGQVQIMRDANGAERGFCRLEDGKRIDEWEYFREQSNKNTPKSP